MNNLWVHPELKATRTGFGSLNYAERVHRSYIHQRRDAVFQGTLLPLFLASCLIIIPFCLGLVILKSSTASTVVMDLMDANFDMFHSRAGHNAKAEFLARLDDAEREEVASKIFYISQKIREARKAAPADEIATAIVSESLKANYDPIFVTAVIMAESTFNKQARSHKGALGLMQLLPDTAKFVSKVGGVRWHGYWNLMNDSSYNIRLGIAYLKYLEDEHNFGREHTLMAYNWGPGNVIKAMKREKSVPLETSRYAKKIVKLHHQWESDFQERRPAFKYMNVNFVAEEDTLPLSTES